ncbi:MAG TPA: ABC transporter ATP-binding protein [Anaerolineae bacterium]|nr:ABC transporter ATP-binding protein [Anaerolineae bacterium]
MSGKKSTVNTRHLLWRLQTYAGKLHLVDIFFWLLIMGLPAAPGLILQGFFDTLTGESQLDWSPWVWIVWLLVAGLARLVALFAGRWTKSQHRFIMSSLVRHNLLKQLLGWPGAAPISVTGEAEAAVSPGELISYFRDDAQQAEDVVQHFAEVVDMGLFALGAVIILVTVNAQMTALIFIPLLLIVGVAQYAGQRIKRYRRAGRRATEQVTGLLGEMFTAIQAIKVAGAEKPILAHLEVLNDARRETMVQDAMFSALLRSVFTNIVSLGVGVMLLVTATSLQDGSMTIGDFALFVYFLEFVTTFLGFLGGLLATYKQVEVSFERMDDVLPGVEAAEIVAHSPLYTNSMLGKRRTLPAIPQPDYGGDNRLERLVVRGLGYRYPHSQNGIEGIDLEIKRGELVAITGRIGAGKTTLLQALLGLLPAEGEIYWNGARVAAPGQFFVPPRAAYTPQVPQLFSQNLVDNLLLGLEADEGLVAKAVQAAVFEEDLRQMPAGYETMIGPNGVRLSGGQRQRLAAARMLVRRPELLVFDDLSSALDVHTERLLWERLWGWRDERYQPTCLVVTHRPLVLARADRVLEMVGGRLV